jgi:hypothetical protein
MDSTALLKYFRAQVADDVTPYLWSVPECITYMNEAQTMFCRLTKGISDATSPTVCVVPVVTGEIFASVHPSIKHFRTATLSSDGKALVIRNHTDVRQWTNQQGTVGKMIVGMEANKVRWDYTPRFDDEVNLLVFRLPLEEITDVDQELEIDPRHHVSLVHWMKYLAYSKQDSQIYDAQTAEKEKALFEKYCVQVDAERDFQTHAPVAILYGGL